MPFHVLTDNLSYSHTHCPQVEVISLVDLFCFWGIAECHWRHISIEQYTEYHTINQTFNSGRALELEFSSREENHLD